MTTTTETQDTLKAAPRIALFVSDPATRSELEAILGTEYSSFLIITEKEKLKEFDTPLILIVDTIAAAAGVHQLHPVEGTQILVISATKDSEVNSATFEVGGADILNHPFAKKDILTKIDKYLAPFRA